MHISTSFDVFNVSAIPLGVAGQAGAFGTHVRAVVIRFDV
jgi:hypothetical protein